MSARRSATALRAALTFSCAVLVHGAAHAAGDRGFAWDSPIHVALVAVALALLGGAAAALGFGRPAAERRRRLALVRAALPAGSPAGAARGLLAQAAIAGAIFLSEGTVVAPDRVALAVLCGLIALAVSTFVFRRGPRHIVAVLAALHEARERSAAAPPRRTGAPLPALAAGDYRLFVPNRPPPLAA